MFWRRRRRRFDPELADPFGLVAVGGDLHPETLLEAYRSGVFPWYDELSPVLWWSPDPRAILELDGLHISRRLARTIRQGKFRVTIDAAFAEVIRGCADRPGEGTWIFPEIIAAFEELHRLGLAHSVETWLGEELAGGIYGLALGGFFSGESMFYRVPDASKVALAHLVGHLRQQGFTLFDVQVLSPHTQTMGAIEIPRKEYLRRLGEALTLPVQFSGRNAE